LITRDLTACPAWFPFPCRWITREELVEKGFEKLVNEFDGKTAAQQKVGENTWAGAVLWSEVAQCCARLLADYAVSHSNILDVLDAAGTCASWHGLQSAQLSSTVLPGVLTPISSPLLHRSYTQVGEQTRPLTMACIEEFCRDFGLEPEFSMHSNIRGLSGGQKVKLVLAAAMWQNPHMLIMDEPVGVCHHVYTFRWAT
jgi:hypothetical protein